MARKKQKRIESIASLKPAIKQNWFRKMEQTSQAELLTIRDNWKKGKPKLSASALGEKILEYFPEIIVGPKEVARWLREEPKK